MQKAGKYEILGKIGAGGFGVVYEGRDPFIKRRVAIKTLTSEDDELRQRFFREAEIAGNLQHRNIVTIHDFGFEEGVPYLVQEFLSGEDLSQIIVRRDPIPIGRKLDILLQAAHGLAYAHEQGVIHRDIKPNNVRVLEDWRVKIMDFGIAKLAHVESHLTKEGMTIGTAAYLPPEQIRGEKIDQRADIFSFGVLMYELLAYQRPFDGKTLSTLLFQIMSQEPKPLPEVWPEAPPRVARLVMRCLEKEVAKRVGKFSEIESDLTIAIAELDSAGVVDDTNLIPQQPGGARPAPAAVDVRTELRAIGERVRKAIDVGDLTAAELELQLAQKGLGREASYEDLAAPLRHEIENARRRQEEERRRSEKLRLLLARGNERLDAESYADARTAFEAALELDPGHEAAREGISRAEAGLAWLAEQGRRRELAEQWRVRGEALLAQGELDEARVSVREAAALDPDSQPVSRLAASIEAAAAALAERERQRLEAERRERAAAEERERQERAAAEARERQERAAAEARERKAREEAAEQARRERAELEERDRQARLAAERAAAAEAQRVAAEQKRAAEERKAAERAAREAEAALRREQEAERRRAEEAEKAQRKQEAERERAAKRAAAEEADRLRDEERRRTAAAKADLARARSLEATAGTQVPSTSFASAKLTDPQTLKWIGIAAAGLGAVGVALWLLLGGDGRATQADEGAPPTAAASQPASAPASQVATPGAKAPVVPPATAPVSGAVASPATSADPRPSSQGELELAKARGRLDAGDLDGARSALVGALADPVSVARARALASELRRGAVARSIAARTRALTAGAEQYAAATLGAAEREAAEAESQPDPIAGFDSAGRAIELFERAAQEARAKEDAIVSAQSAPPPVSAAASTRPASQPSTAQTGTRPPQSATAPPYPASPAPSAAPPAAQPAPQPAQTTPSSPAPAAVPPASFGNAIAEIRAVLERYRAAHEALDVAALAQVWMLDDGARRQIERAFSGYSSLSMSYDTCRIEAEDDRGTARCRVSQRIDPKVGSDLRSTQEVTFELVRSGERWQIRSRSAR